MTVSEQKAALQEKLKGAPQKYVDFNIKNLERMSFKDDDDFNTYADEVANDLKELQQMQAENKMKGFGPPNKGRKEAKSNSEKEKVDKIVNSMMGLPSRKKANSVKDQTTQNIVKNLMR